MQCSTTRIDGAMNVPGSRRPGGGGGGGAREPNASIMHRLAAQPQGVLWSSAEERARPWSSGGRSRVEARQSSFAKRWQGRGKRRGGVAKARQDRRRHASTMENRRREGFRRGAMMFEDRVDAAERLA